MMGTNKTTEDTFSVNNMKEERRDEICNVLALRRKVLN